MKTWKFLIVLALVVVGTIAAPKIAYASYCSYGGCKGYFKGQTASAAFGTVRNLVSGGVYANNADDFVNTVKGYLNDGGSNQMGAAMLVDEMMGYSHTIGAATNNSNFSDFSQRVHDYASGDSPGYGVNWNVMRSPPGNSAYFTDIDDDAYHTNENGSIAVIEFYHPGGTFKVERFCGNLLGDAPLPKAIDWRVKPKTTVDNAKRLPGQSTTFHFTATNTGPNKANYDWTTEGNPSWVTGGYTHSHNGGTQNSDLPGPGSPNAVAVNDKSPDDKQWNFKMPDDAKGGDKYCARINITNNAFGPNTGSDSDEACVVVPDWRLLGESRVSSATARPSSNSVTFSHRIQNSSTTDDTAKFDWTVKGQYTPVNGTPGAVTVVNSKTGQSTAAGVYGPAYTDTPPVNNYSFPAGVKDGDSYCQWISYTLAWGPNSSADSDKDAAACVVYRTSNAPWTLVPTTTVTTTTATRGETVTFDHDVNNTGPQTATYNWHVVCTAGFGVSNCPADYVNSNTAKSSSRPAFGGGARHAFAFPASSQIGDTYCEYIIATAGTGPGTPQIASAQKCVTLANGPVTGTSNVLISPNVSAPAQTEVGSTITMQGSINVSNFPTTTQWGYTEDSVAAPATRVSAYIVTVGLQSRDVIVAGSTTTTVAATATPCVKDPTKTCYFCPSGTPSGSGAAKKCTIVTPTNVTKTEYKCSSDANWGPPGGAAPTCKDQYACPGGAAVVGSAWAYTAPACDGWQCKYELGTATQTNSATAPQCDARCNNGAGSTPAPLSTGTYHLGGDRHCYQQPSFDVTCTFNYGASQTVTVNQNNSYGCASQSLGTSQIGQLLCATMTARVTSGWRPVAPGTATGTTWGMTVNPTSSTACTQVVGKPYVKVYGGDVSVGGGVGKTGASDCRTTTAQIKTYNQGAGGSYAGSGGAVGVFATGFIDQFISGQYNALLNTSPSPGSAPNKLSFANNIPASPTYGGGFASVPGGCTGYVSKLPTNAQTSGSSYINGAADSVALVTAANHTVVKHVTGNVYIYNNVLYTPLWTSALDQIPLYQLVVEGDIYIDSSVTQLDGLYVAIRDNNTATGGNIYTCASVSPAQIAANNTGAIANSYITATFNGQCNKQLVVNGSFVADTIHYQRDCGSLYKAYGTEHSVASGGTDSQNCSATNHAAEVFNYSPEQWLHTSGSAKKTQYDSISSLPPVL